MLGSTKSKIDGNQQVTLFKRGANSSAATTEQISLSVTVQQSDPSKVGETQTQERSNGKDPMNIFEKLTWRPFLFVWLNPEHDPMNSHKGAREALRLITQVITSSLTGTMAF